MQKPDYEYLMKLDSWSKKDAALIISGLEPDKYRQIRFTYNYLDFEKYPELVQVYKLYKLFLSIDFRQQHREYQTNPIAYIVECRKRDWLIPDELFNLARERYAKEKELKKSSMVNEEESAGIKDKEYLLKTLGVLVKFYVHKQNNSRLGDFNNINISQVVNDVLQFMEDNEIEIYGLRKSSLNSRFSEGIKAIENCL